MSTQPEINHVITFIEKLETFCNRSFEIANYHRNEGREDGLAFYYYGRLTSCFMGVKTLLYTLDKSAGQAGFDTEYISSVLPTSFPRRDLEVAKKYIKETHMAIRFVLFQNFYSQTEFTYRIIQREKFADELGANPFRLMTDKFGIMSVDFTKLLNAMRNTIHNNGHYFPKDNRSDFEYTFKEKRFVFEYGKPIIEVTMPDIIDMIDYIIEENKTLFENEELAKIEFC